VTRPGGRIALANWSPTGCVAKMFKGMAPYMPAPPTSYGPTKTLAESLDDRREELHRDWVEFFETNYRSNGEIVHTREYLLVVGTRR